jgi:hypothetical protein
VELEGECGAGLMTILWESRRGGEEGFVAAKSKCSFTSPRREPLSKRERGGSASAESFK